ncbi:MAG TPA: hypothetical protein PLB02_02835 [Thermoanaerobaculia bacterium]|nr:hypothetical protein [Thermoanaerobaculia bacterium]HQR66307.1 hypothetical protein [Thermoanaerobaculia bacterium]
MSEPDPKPEEKPESKPNGELKPEDLEKVSGGVASLPDPKHASLVSPRQPVFGGAPILTNA